MEGKRKDYSEYTRSKDSKELFREVSNHTGIPVSSLTFCVGGRGHDVVRGTFVHPKIIPHVASWCSKKFAVLVSDIVNAHFAKEALDAKEAETARLLGEKDIAYAKLSRQMKRQSEQMSRDFAAQKAETDRVLSAIGFVQEQNVDLKQQASALETHLVDVKHKLRIVSVDRVYRTRDGDDYNILTIVYNGSVYISKDADSDASDQEPPYPYSVIRAAKGNVATLLNRIMAKYPEAEILYQLDNPNAIISWKYYLQKYGKHIDKKGCQFSFRGQYSVERFWRHLQRCNQKKMNEVEA